MNIKKARNRDAKRQKRLYGMRVGSKSVLLIQEIQRKRAEKQRQRDDNEIHG